MKQETSDKTGVTRIRINQQNVTFEPNCRGCDKIRQDDSHQNVIDSNEHNITSKLLRIFKSKKWSRQKTTTTRNNEIVFDKPLSFPKVKLRKNAPQVQSVIEPGSKSNHLTKRPEMSLINKSPLKISKSLPVRKPTIVWEEIQEFQKLLAIQDDFREEDTEEVRNTVGTQTDISWMRNGLEHRRLERVSLTNQRLDLKPALTNEVPQQPKRVSLTNQRLDLKPLTNEVPQQHKRVSLDITRSSDDDECNLEVFQTICGDGSHGDSAQSSLMSTSSRSRDVDGISSVISEMISPTMMMETEVDTDTDTIEETDNDKNNIYEEVLNNETYRRRHNHSKLSTTSSIYRSSWWEQTSNVRYNENYHHQVQNHSVPKPKLCRTAKSLHGPHSGRFSSSALGSRHGAGPELGEKQKPVIKGGVSKTLSEKFSNLGMRNYSVFRNGK